MHPCAQLQAVFFGSQVAVDPAPMTQGHAAMAKTKAKGTDMLDRAGAAHHEQVAEVSAKKGSMHSVPGAWSEKRSKIHCSLCVPYTRTVFRAWSVVAAKCWQAATICAQTTVKH